MGAEAKAKAYKDTVEITKAALENTQVHVLVGENHEEVTAFIQATYDKLAEIAEGTGYFS